MGRKRVNKYPIVFRQMALERMKNCVSVSALADELGVHRTVLYQWQRQLEAGHDGTPSSVIRGLRRQPSLFRVNQAHCEIPDRESKGYRLGHRFRYNFGTTKAREEGLFVPKRHQMKHLDFDLPLVRDQGVGGSNPLSPTNFFNDI